MQYLTPGESLVPAREPVHDVHLHPRHEGERGADLVRVRVRVRVRVGGHVLVRVRVRVKESAAPTRSGAASRATLT